MEEGVSTDETGESGELSDRSVEEPCGLKDELADDETPNYGDVIGLTADAILRKVFRSDNGAYEFYKRFGKCHRFSVRKGDCGREGEGRFIKRRFFCNRARLRELKHYNRLDWWRVHKPETMTKCEQGKAVCIP
ncbi:hypothetical protein PIB30_032140 [Stylosanthes scabra]|uniref:FAR1 domain-containing protein n=1 Tax=Stylosanthes scabra TaxID=79078 RepID=A0ABU6XAL1_9FABA|nr:hypothetical protein [Stylosanthes scabra]